MNYAAIYAGLACLNVVALVGGLAGLFSWGAVLIISVAVGLTSWAVHEHEERDG